MPISYNEAQEILRVSARTFSPHSESVPLLQSVRRVTSHAVLSNVTIPPYDTSAMDGFALASGATLSATPSNPILLPIRGTMAAEDSPMQVEYGCVEIMTGARFPRGMDACIPIEFADVFDGYLKVTHPVRRNQHRRLAGSDFQPGEVLLEAKTTIGDHHIMALAAAGIEMVAVMNVDLVVWTTGSEIGNHDSACIRNSNGPYVQKALEDMGNVLAMHVADDVDAIRQVIRKFQGDVLVFTGGVSAGKFDFVRACLEAEGANIQFHKVSVRPGHPVLFATRHRQAIFGLPGNPLAAAACLQFFVLPFLRHVLHQPAASLDVEMTFETKLDVFRLGKLQGPFISLTDDQASYKMSPMTRSNCWVWFAPSGKARAYPFRGAVIPQVKVLYLAGGVSSRMGIKKHLLPMEGVPAYQHFRSRIRGDIYISVRAGEQLPCKCIVDEQEDIGPASGLLAAHAYDKSCIWMVVACDYPFIEQETLDQLLEHNSAVTCFVNDEGFTEPLLGAWRPEALEKLKDNVSHGFWGPKSTVQQLEKEGKASIVRPRRPEWVKGANTPEEWESCMRAKLPSSHKISFTNSIPTCAALSGRSVVS